MKQLLYAIIVGIIAMGFLFIVFLPQRRPRADWLEVSLPEVFVTGEWNEIRIRVNRRAPELTLVVDLHWAGYRSSGYLSSAQQYFVVKAGQDLLYRFYVDSDLEYRYVFPVYFLTPDGNWQNAVLSAAGPSRYLVRQDQKGRSPVGEGPFERPFLRATASEQDPDQTSLNDSVKDDTACPGVILLYVVAAIAVMLLLRAAFLYSLAGHTGFSRVLASATVVLILFLWLEQSGLDLFITEVFRAIFRRVGLYSRRRFFQRLILSFATLVLSFAYYRFLLSRRLRSAIKLIVSGTGFYLFLRMVEIVSLHAVDRFMELRILSAGFINVLQIGMLLLVICGAAMLQKKGAGIE